MSAFLGRAQELETLLAGLRRAAGGVGSAFALVGEAGIGKTRLATELCTRAPDLGMSVHWGRAWETGGAPSLWPWRQLVESVHPRLAADVPSGALGRLWGASAESSTSDPQQARFELFDAVVRALREGAQRGPLLCVLDDLHAADVASLELGTFAVRALGGTRIAWVLTYRDAEAGYPAVRDSLARLARAASVMQLRGLSRTETGELVTELLPGADPKLPDVLFRATSGNPLFLCETVRAVADGRVSSLSHDESLPVAQGVALVVRDRLATLSEEARRLVQIGSVLGRVVDAELAARAAHIDVVTLQRSAEEATQRGLWREGGPGRWIFSHALVRDALYREIAAGERSELHERVASALDAKVEQGERSLSLTRAHHGLAARPRGDIERVVDWVVAGAQHARGQRAYEEAVALLERAVRELTDATDAQRGRLLLALGWAYGDAGDTASLCRTFDQAIVVARKLGSASLLAQAVLGRGSFYLLGTIRSELIPLLDEALASLGPGDVDLRARLLARKASALTPAADPAEPLALAREAVVAVARSQDARAILDVCVGAGSAMGEFVGPQERIPVNEQLTRLAHAKEDRVLELRGLSRLVADYLEAGDVPRADAVLLERDALAAALGHPRFRWMTPVFRSVRAMISGRFDVCEEAVREARQLARAADDENAPRCLAVHWSSVLMLWDRVDLLQEHEAEYVRRVHPMPALPDLMRAIVAGRAGNLKQARAHFTRAAGERLEFLQSTAILTMAADVAVMCGELGMIRLCYELLAPSAQSNATVGLFGPSCGVPVHAVLGRLAHALGRAEAREHFEAALDRVDAMSARGHEPWVRLWYGRALLEAPATAAEGRAQLAQAAEIAHAIRAHHLAGRAEQCLASSPASTRAAPSSPRGAESAGAEPMTFTLERHQEGWRIERAGRVLVLRDLRGLQMLAELLAKPDQELHALDLVTGGSEPEARDAGDAGEMLDEKARSAYRRRIEALRERIEDAEERSDAEDAEGARSELEILSHELSRAVGLGARVRRAGSSAERARVTAQRRLREAIKRVAELDEELGDYLDRTIRTGTFCAYEPNRRAR